MTIQLMEGQFSANEAIDFITKMVQIKIKFLEDKINAHASEEGIKMRESRIKQLQKELFEVRNFIDAITKGVKVNAMISID
jgi:hypothetical protein